MPILELSLYQWNYIICSVIWYITLDFPIVNQSCIFGIDATWLLRIIFLIHFRIKFAHRLRTFASMCMNDVGL